MEKNFFVKAHGLGNEYIVLDATNIGFRPGTNAIKRLCNVNFGIGSDGVLLKTESRKADFGLKIYNPDGSEAEKSGNGLRIFCKFVYDYGFAKNREFTVETLGGIVKASILKEAKGKATLISVDMGKAIFASKEIPVHSDLPEFTGQKLQLKNKEYIVTCVSVGNPHCVIIKNDLDIAEIREFGPQIEHHNLFPNRINVQFAKVLSPTEAQILIWERGAGYTLASGSSSCAVASVLAKLNLTGSDVTIRMQGGSLDISISKNWDIRMTGEVQEIARGFLSDELVEVLESPFIVGF